VTLLLLGSAVVYYRMSPGITPTAIAAPSANGSTQSEPSPLVGASTTVLTPTPTPTPSPTPSPSPTRPTPSSRPGAQPGVTDPGILLTATVAGDGSFEVTELVRLPEPMATLSVAPANLREIGRGFDRVRPVVSRASVSADGHHVSTPGRVGGHLKLVAASAATRWKLHYRVSGVMIRSVPSRAGRALAALRPFVVGLPADLPVAVMVTGRPAINLVCPNLPFADQVCYVGAPSHLRVVHPLAFGDAVVLVQLNLTTAP
jgi:hypothetical protein